MRKKLWGRRLRVAGTLLTASVVAIPLVGLVGGGSPADASPNYTTNESALSSPQTNISGSYTGMRFFINAHADDDSGAAPLQFGNGGSLFPVMVYLTNGENTGFCVGPKTTGPNGGSVLTPAAGTTLHIQGDDPAVFPWDPDMNTSTGWGPMYADPYNASSSTGQTVASAGLCREDRITSMISYWNQAYSMPTSNPTPHPASQYAAPDGQVCFTSRPPVPYQENDPSTGAPSTVSTKDPCAYTWRTPTGDIVVFNLGDLNQGWFSCPNYANTTQWLSDGPAGGCGSGQALDPDGSGGYTAQSQGNEGYALSPADTMWAVDQLENSVGSLLPNYPVHDVVSASYYNGPGQSDSGATAPNNEYMNSLPASQSGGYDNSANGQPCYTYTHYNHYAVQRALFRNSGPASSWSMGRTCAGDSDASQEATLPSVANTDQLMQQYSTGVGNCGSDCSYYVQNFGWLQVPFDNYQAQTCTVGGQVEDPWSCIASFWHVSVPYNTPSWNMPGM